MNRWLSIALKLNSTAWPLHSHRRHEPLAYVKHFANNCLCFLCKQFFVLSKAISCHIFVGIGVLEKDIFFKENEFFSRNVFSKKKILTQMKTSARHKKSLQMLSSHPSMPLQMICKIGGLCFQPTSSRHH